MEREENGEAKKTHRIVKRSDGGKDRKMKDTKMEGKRAWDRWIEAKVVWIL